MRISLSMGAGRACVAAIMVALLGAPPALSRPTPSGLGFRVGMVRSHAQWASRGWTRNAWAWQGQNGWSRSSRWKSWGRHRWYWSQAGLYGFGYWPSPDAYVSAAMPSGDEAPTIVIGAPLDAYPPAEPASFGRAVGGGCVIHKLIYDANGKYVGEQQTPEC
jgi:hypothetical protein